MTNERTATPDGSDGGARTEHAWGDAGSPGVRAGGGGVPWARVAVVGATGYTGSELVRLLSAHPYAEIAAITSERRAGERFSAVHPAFRGVEDRLLVRADALEAMDVDLVFLALPHTVSMGFVEAHGVERFRIIDLSGDFRLRSPAAYERWYGTPHRVHDALEQAVYGLPERGRAAIRGARLVANPGCYPTSALLALAPLLERELIHPDGIIVDSKSGVTGAGASPKPTTHFPRVFGNFNAYSLLSHRHAPEMEQLLSSAAGRAVTLLFTPHLLPVDRGILTTAYAVAHKGVDARRVQDALHQAYEAEPFVRLCDGPPCLKDVRGTNFCDLHVTFDPRTQRVVALSVIDNLVKGAAGQAVQNMNLMLGWPETTGLTQGAISP